MMYAFFGAYRFDTEMPYGDDGSHTEDHDGDIYKMNHDHFSPET